MNYEIEKVNHALRRGTLNSMAFRRCSPSHLPWRAAQNWRAHRSDSVSPSTLI